MELVFARLLFVRVSLLGGDVVEYYTLLNQINMMTVVNEGRQSSTTERDGKDQHLDAEHVRMSTRKIYLPSQTRQPSFQKRS